MDYGHLPDKATLILSENEISQRVRALGSLISFDYHSVLKKDDLLLVIGVLNGAFVFMADLIREMSVALEVDFVRLSSYSDSKTSSSQVVMLKGLEREIKDRHVLVVEDIADCGLTLAWFVDHLKSRQPASIKLAVAFDKKSRRQIDLNLDYVGFELDEGFLVGYGLDAARRYRELKGIYSIED
ncbi:MAG: hypoxanthine phosphoribosyltransferase [Deltaproteobacteria bacterium]|jgi:hypoxanthine phosphoribosyltransferase|nr:hypoxanthine phosphoribosyltransferase [Deltaproteobacteria bacterium]